MAKNKKQPKTNQSSTNSRAKITWLPKKTFELEFSIPWSKVKKTYDKTLNSLTKDTKLEGFRKGKAPKKIVEQSIDKTRLYGEIVNQLLPESYIKAVKQHNLKPIVNPKIQILKAEENQSWQFKATSCELPEINLGDYQKIVKGALAKEKIWTPDKGLPTAGNDSKTKKPKELSPTQKLDQASKALIDEIKLELPDLLINTEKDRLLANLLNQTQKLGITIEQYAESANKTVEAIKQEHQKIAENSLKMELILQAIAADKKITINDKEIDKMIAASGDEKIKKQLNTPEKRAHIASILKKRQVIDYLLSL